MDQMLPEVQEGEEGNRGRSRRRRNGEEREMGRGRRMVFRRKKIFVTFKLRRKIF